MLRASAGGHTEVVGVGVACVDDSHCEQIACETRTCIDYACTYVNAAQGTPCEDGTFCTDTNECYGNGACVGSGTPCALPLSAC